MEMCDGQAKAGGEDKARRGTVAGGLARAEHTHTPFEMGRSSARPIAQRFQATSCAGTRERKTVRPSLSQMSIQVMSSNLHLAS